ncbi:hypothetical protein A1O3_09709 [Capronia epimyces CBS 606.96]|uniref:Uncharacterized protein n=1 Tax=Capronia epimyces CBS 606.96 TaxID=1182542 RepID=W9XB97_9EURO|nr:uncharacterized protein A1O3_09709 [Capronia epimyces CBS 606.96]EXJ77483.1 hypothetical protein A1O3_09709 [Capronia epimyces CBS 606.96]
MKFITRQVSTGDIFPISQPRRPRQRDRDQEQAQDEDQPLKPVRPQQPALLRLHRFRTIVLPMLLVLVFTSLILAAIYAYCVAKPHTQIADRLAQNSTAEADSSLFGKRALAPGFSLPLPLPLHTIASTLTLTTRSTTSQTEPQGQPVTALLFYTLTTPGVSLVHLSFELITHHHNAEHLHGRRVYFAVLAASSLLVAGWITTLSFWMHCELPSLNKSSFQSNSSSSSHSIASQAFCPAQVRGHFMYGIHEVSIVKAVLAWVIVLVYLCHIVLLGLALKAQRRMWRLTRSLEIEHGEASEVVIRLEDEEGDGSGRGHGHGNGKGLVGKEMTL